MAADIPPDGQAVALIVLPGDDSDLAVVKGGQELVLEAIGGAGPAFVGLDAHVAVEIGDAGPIGQEPRSFGGERHGRRDHLNAFALHVLGVHLQGFALGTRPRIALLAIGSPRAGHQGHAEG